jgi:ketosteroid isomerase-like protein
VKQSAKELLMKLGLLLIFLLASFTGAYAQTTTKPLTKQASNTGQELIRLNQELIDALARGDKSVAERIYADNFVRITTQGGVLTKAQVLESLRASEAGVKISYESKDIKVFDYGDVAVLVYLSIRHTDNKGEKSDFLYRVTDTFVKSNRRWVKAASAGTPIPK